MTDVSTGSLVTMYSVFSDASTLFFLAMSAWYIRPIMILCCIFVI
jgi:hypothetical protein